MKLLDMFFLNTSIIVTPILIYLLYSAYVKVQDKKEDGLIFSVIIFLQIYLIFKYSSPFNDELPLFFVDIPFIIAFLKKNKLLIVIIGLINIIYYNLFYSNSLFIIVSEYIIYVFVFLRANRVIYFWLIKYIFLTYYSGLSINYLFEILIMLLFSIFIIYLLKKSEELFNLHSKLKHVFKEKQIQKSLFKITHEIKNPIAVCKGYLDMYDESDENTKEYIPIIKEEIDRVLVLLEDFLSMNKQKISKEIIDINFLLEDVVNSMNYLFKSRNVFLESCNFDDEIFIEGDYNRLTQVFINILKNSIEALDNKKKSFVKIWTENNNNKIIIHIIDNGVGIAKEDMKKIKEPFFTTKVRGTGLGVSLSDEIIKAHKGSLDYISKKNMGTEVIVSLPLKKAI